MARFDRRILPGLEAAAGRAVGALATGLAVAGGILLLAVTAVTLASIAGSAISALGEGPPFDRFGPLKGEIDLVTVGAAIAVFAFLPLCQFRRGHVTVDVFLIRAGPRLVAFTSLAGNILLTLAALLIAWRLAAGLADKRAYGETSFILQMPLWWGYAGALVGASAFALVSLYTVWRSLNEWLWQGETIFPEAAR